MDYSLQVEQEEDGRCLAEVPELPGALAYGASSDEATVRAETLALRIIAERLDHRGAAGAWRGEAPVHPSPARGMSDWPSTKASGSSRPCSRSVGR